MVNYGLTAIQVGFGTGTRKLRIQWSATLPYEATLTVTRGGDGQRVFSKSYHRSVTSDDITIDVPWYGEFKVELKLNSPAIGSHVIYPEVKMYGTHTNPTFVYNAEAVKQAELKQQVIVGIQVLAGTLRLVGNTISFFFGTLSMYNDIVTFPFPKVGEKVDVTVKAASNGGADITTTYTEIAYTDRFGNTISERKIVKQSHIAYVPWTFGK